MSIDIREKIKGSWRYCRIKEGRGIKTGELAGPFFSRAFISGWQDIGWDRKQLHIRRKEDVGFKPKAHESRTVPMPNSLVELLKARRKNPPHSRRIYANEDGNPENHLLRKLKTIALRAGLNCGQCKTIFTKGR